MFGFVGRGDGRTLGGPSFAHTPLVLVDRSRVRSLRHPQFCNFSAHCNVAVRKQDSHASILRVEFTETQAGELKALHLGSGISQRRFYLSDTPAADTSASASAKVCDSPINNWVQKKEHQDGIIKQASASKCMPLFINPGFLLGNTSSTI